MPPAWTIAEPVVPCDSAYDYQHVIDNNEEHLRLDLTPGDYTVEATYAEIPQAYLILARLTPTGTAPSTPGR